MEILEAINSICIGGCGLCNSRQSIQRFDFGAGNYCTAWISYISGQGTIEHLCLNSSGHGKYQQCENGKCGNQYAMRHSVRFASLKLCKHELSPLTLCGPDTCRAAIYSNGFYPRDRHTAR